MRSFRAQAIGEANKTFGRLGSVRLSFSCPQHIVADSTLAGVLTLWVLNAASKPYGLESPLIMFVAPIVGMAILTNYALGLTAAVLRSKRRKSPERRSWSWKWAVVPICLCLLWWATSSDWLLRKRFAISRPAFERAAKDYLAGISRTTPRWKGLYRVWDISSYDPGTAAFMTGQTFIDVCGFEFRSDDKPDTPDASDRLAPHWHIVKR